MGSSRSKTILAVGVAVGHADDVVDLDLAAGPDAEVALDAGVEVDAHRRVAGVVGPALGGGEAAGGDAGAVCPVFQKALVGSWEVARAGWSATRSSMTMARALVAARSVRYGPSCRRRARACRRGRGRARPRSPPCRRGSCRRGGSPAPDGGRDGGCRCRAGGRRPRWISPGRAEHGHAVQLEARGRAVFGGGAVEVLRIPRHGGAAHGGGLPGGLRGSI